MGDLRELWADRPRIWFDRRTHPGPLSDCPLCTDGQRPEPAPAGGEEPDHG